MLFCLGCSRDSMKGSDNHRAQRSSDTIMIITITFMPSCLQPRLRCWALSPQFHRESRFLLNSCCQQGDARWPCATTAINHPPLSHQHHEEMKDQVFSFNRSFKRIFFDIIDWITIKDSQTAIETQVAEAIHFKNAMGPSQPCLRLTTSFVSKIWVRWWWCMLDHHHNSHGHSSLADRAILTRTTTQCCPSITQTAGHGQRRV